MAAPRLSRRTGWLGVPGRVALPMNPCAGDAPFLDRRHQPVPIEQADERFSVAEVGREELSWGVGREGGSLMTEMRKPAAVNASDMACNRRCQSVSSARWPSKVYSSVYGVREK